MYSDRTGIVPVKTAVPYNAANFSTAGGMVWTVDLADQLEYSFMVVENIMTVFWYFDTTTIGAPLSNTIRIKIPAGKVADTRTNGVGVVLENGAWANVMLQIGAGQSNITILKFGGNYLAGADNVIVAGQITFWVR